MLPTPKTLSFTLQNSKKFAIGILVVFLVYEFAGALLFKVDPATVPVWDTSGYVTALLQYENPTALPKDTIFSNHKFSDSIWSSSALYMYGLELLHQATQHNIARAFSLLRVLILLLYLPLMYFLLLQITKNPLIAAMLSIVSSYPAAFLATDRFWGIAIDFSKLVPETLYMPFSVLLGLLAYQYWFAPGAKNRRIVPWHILAIGILAGTGVFLVHAITSIAAIELLILFGFLQSLRRKIPLWSVILFGVVTIPALVVRLFSGSGVPAQLSAADANVILDIGQFWMIFPWTGRWSLTTLTPNSAMLAPVLAFFFVLYIVFSLLCMLGIARSSRFRQPAKVLFVSLQVGYALLWLQAGWIPLVLLAYGFYRIWTKTEDELDRSLLLIFVIANLIGPAQQTAVYYLYQIGKFSNLVGLLFELARFQVLAYLPFYLLLGRAIVLLTRGKQGSGVMIGEAIVLIALIFLNLQRFAFPLGPFSFEQVLLLLFVLIWAVKTILLAKANIQPQVSNAQENTDLFLGGLLGRWGTSLAAFSLITRHGQGSGKLSKRIRWKYIALTVPLVAISFSILFFALQRAYTFDTLMQQMSELPGLAKRDHDYLEMAAWAKANTLPDSLFLLSDLESNFRYFAERSLVIGYTDVTLGVYTGISSTTLARLYDDVHTYAKQPDYLACFAGNNHADYVVTDANPRLSACNREGVRYNPQLMFQNDVFALYRIDKPAR